MTQIVCEKAFEGCSLKGIWNAAREKPPTITSDWKATKELFGTEFASGLCADSKKTNAGNKHCIQQYLNSCLLYSRDPYFWKGRFDNVTTNGHRLLLSRITSLMGAFHSQHAESLSL